MLIIHLPGVLLLQDLQTSMSSLPEPLQEQAAPNQAASVPNMGPSDTEQAQPRYSFADMLLSCLFCLSAVIVLKRTLPSCITSLSNACSEQEQPACNGNAASSAERQSANADTYTKQLKWELENEELTDAVTAYLEDPAFYEYVGKLEAVLDSLGMDVVPDDFQDVLSLVQDTP